MAAQAPTPAAPPPPAGGEPGAQDPVGQDPARVDGPIPTVGGDPYYPGAIAALKGKLVRSIKVVEAEASDGEVVGAAKPLDAGSIESIVRGLETRVGQPFEPRKVSADCEGLWAERRLVVAVYVEEVDDEVVVTFQVNQKIAVYDGVEFVGLELLDEQEVNGLLGLHADRQTTETEAEAMRKLLLARYHRDGYAFCNIRLVELPLQDGEGAGGGSSERRVKLRFLVEEGAKVTVRDIDFIGNDSFAAEAVLGQFGTDSFLVRDARIESDPAGITKGGAYSREILEEDLDRLRLFYRSRGFLEATVDLADVRFSEDRDEVDLTIVVVEGPRYRIRSVRVEHVTPERQPLAGEPLYPPAEVEQVLAVKPGEFYDNEQLQRDQLEIEEFYGRRGHPPVSFPGMRNTPTQGCQAFPALELYGEGAEVDIVFQVSEGSPKRLRDVVIRGNRFTRDAVIRRRFRVLPGERIDMYEVRRALQRLESSRFFQDAITLRGPRLQVEPVPGRPDLVDLGLDVVDGPTGELRWGVGISTGIGAQANIQFNKRNFDLFNLPSSPNPVTAIGEVLDAKAFHGGGQDLRLLLAPGSRQSQFSLTFVEPDVFAQHLDTYELRVSASRLIRRLPDGYTSDVLGGEVGLSRYFSEEFSAGVAVRHETVEIDQLASNATALAFDAEGQSELRGARASIRYRDFDDFLRPTSGVDLSLSFELIGGMFGGDESLSKWTHRADIYLPITENEMKHRTVFHWRQFFGFAEEYGASNDVFLTERFYMGGANLRGFDFRRAGPTQFGRPLGGEAVYTASAEVYFPLVATRLEGEINDRELLRWVLFTDVGFLGLGIGDPTFGEMRASYGVGLRIEIPYLELPIALDLGWPFLYEETDDRRQLYFSISR